jgi:hypothetical protein
VLLLLPLPALLLLPALVIVTMVVERASALSPAAWSAVSPRPAS